MRLLLVSSLPPELPHCPGSSEIKKLEHELIIIASLMNILFTKVLPEQYHCSDDTSVISEFILLNNENKEPDQTFSPCGDCFYYLSWQAAAGREGVNPVNSCTEGSDTCLVSRS